MQKVVKTTKNMNLLENGGHDFSISVPVNGKFLKAYYRDGNLTIFYLAEENCLFSMKDFRIIASRESSIEDEYKHLTTFVLSNEFFSSFFHLFVFESE